MYFTQSEAADRLGIHLNTIKRQIKANHDKLAAHLNDLNQVDEEGLEILRTLIPSAIKAEKLSEADI